MKNIKKISKALGIYLAIFSLVFSNFQSAFAVTANENKEQNQQTEEAVLDEAYATGANPLTEEDKKWMEENMITSETILPNKLGLERSNEVRVKKGLEKIDESRAVEIGNEVIPDSKKAILAVSNATVSNTSSLGTVTEGATSTATAIAPSDLPRGVDNSELPFFPEIRNQGRLGSCAAFSTTYYQATYMTAMARGWDVKHGGDDLKFSAKWTYNFINGGKNGGSNQVNAFKVFKEQGIATLKDFPYNDGPNVTSKDYLEWSSKESVWKNALSFQADKVGIEKLDDEITPIEKAGDHTLDKVKQLISNGYIFAFSTTWYSLKYMPIEGAEDDKNIGRAAISMLDYNQDTDAESGHAMTIVGYNDDIWVDINNDNIAQDGEKGAFKVANSHGANWGVDPMNETITNDGDGFVWICYDALNKVSSVTNAPKAVYERQSAIWDNSFYWMTAKTENTPSLIAAIDITHQKRNQLTYEVGYSDTTEADAKIIWKPSIVNRRPGAYAFNGSEGTPSQGTILLDYSYIINGANLSNVSKKWYVRITDSQQDGIGATNINFKLIDKNGVEHPCSTQNSQVDGNTIILSVEYALDSTSNSSTQLTYRENTICNYRNLHNDILTYSNPLTNSNEMYMYDVVNDRLIKYDSSNDNWSIYKENWLGKGPKYANRESFKLVLCEDKIYVFTKDTNIENSQIKKVQAYNINQQDWETGVAIPDIPETRSYFSISECNGKIYIIGGRKYINGIYQGMASSILEYNPKKNEWISKSGMVTNSAFFLSVESNGVIYSLRGFSGSGKHLRTIEKFDPNSNISEVVGYIPESISLDSIKKVVEFNGKLYVCMYGASNLDDLNIHVYDPVDNDWEKEYYLPTGSGDNIIKESGDGIFVMPCETTHFFKFNPSIQDVPRVGLPYFSTLSGSSSTENIIKISCFTSDSTIRYTIDGSIPTENSTLYNGPISVTKDTTIKAIAIKSGMTSSYVNTGYYGVIAKPVFSLGEGSYSKGKKLAMSCISKDTVIRYTTDGSEPDETSAIYTEPINIIGNVKVKAISIKLGEFKSEVTTEEFRIQSVIGDVTGDGIVDIMDQLAISNYLNNPSDPKNNFTIDDDLWGGDLNGDGKIYFDDLTLIRQFIIEEINYFPKEAIATNLSLQATTEKSITIGWDKSLGLTPIAKYEIYRDNTLIGTSDSTSYTDTGLITNKEYEYTIKPIDEDYEFSIPSTSVKITAGVVMTPTLSVAGGLYNSIQTVTINCATPGAIIVYTTDGTEPTSSSAIYIEPIAIAGTKTIKAKAIKTAMADSSLVSSEYKMSFKIGDVNGDGSINEADLFLIRACVIDDSTDACPVEDALWVADVDGTGEVDISDWMILQNYLNGKITKFPKAA